MGEINFSTGVVEMKVNGGRSILLNPADLGFAERMFSLASKIEKIEAESRKKREATEDMTKVFDYYRASDKLMREAVDAVFGENFCKDVFHGIRLTALADGLTVIENFIFAVLDQMDDSVTENLAKRNQRVQKYLEKYKKAKT